MAKNELTVTQAAERLKVAAITVRKWCKRGLFPNAYMHETPLGALWLIPESDVKNFQPPTMGRPPKPKEEAEKSAAKKRVRKKDPSRLLKTLS
jgi:excisionase family DNA binding protein